MDRRATALDSALEKQGLGRGDNVGLQLRNSPAYLEAFFACCRMGARPANISYRYTAAELAPLFDSLDLKTLVFSGDYAREVLAATESVDGLNTLIRGCRCGLGHGENGRNLYRI